MLIHFLQLKKLILYAGKDLIRRSITKYNETENMLTFVSTETPRVMWGE